MDSLSCEPYLMTLGCKQWFSNRKHLITGLSDLSDTESTEKSTPKPYLIALGCKQRFSNRKHHTTGLFNLSDTESTKNGTLQPYLMALRHKQGFIVTENTLRQDFSDAESTENDRLQFSC